VLAFHCWTFGFYTPGSVGWAELPFSAGHLGVPIFLVLSGFCLALPYVGSDRKLDLRAFAIRRAVRILPPYWIWVLVFAGLELIQARVGAFQVRSVQPLTDPVDVLWHLGLIQNLSAEHFFRINGALWSVALECQLYFVFPLLLLLWRRPSVLLLVCGLLSLGGWIYAFASRLDVASAVGAAVWASPVSYLVVFGLGICSATWRSRSVFEGWLGSALAVGLLVGAAIADRVWANVPAIAMMLAALGTVCVLVSGSDSFVGRGLSWRWLVRVGWVSYTLYLIHNPLVSFGGKVLRPRVEGCALAGGMFVFAGLAVGLAFVFFPFLEQPFHRLAKRLSKPI
jgi:peptidoglycan/LPS O-acetylase OafA/YrhL